jgi:hypothetical protein
MNERVCKGRHDAQAMRHEVPVLFISREPFKYTFHFSGVLAQWTFN